MSGVAAIERLEMLVAWKTPNGRKPSKRMPDAYETTRDALALLKELSASNARLREVVATTINCGVLDGTRLLQARTALESSK